MYARIREFVFGPPLPTAQEAGRGLNKIRALAAFSPDALSSIAYANQEIYLALLVAGAAGLSLAFPVGAAIVVVLVLVAISYWQTVHAYPSGGGSWIVARANLGTIPGLIAGSALMIDYMLAAAVSLTAGVEALASAFPVLWTHRVAASLLLLALITWVNLRGVRETGTAMSVPVYFFLFVYLSMLAVGAYRAITEGPGSLVAAAPAAAQPVTFLLILHAFSTGCTALTGIEAISNGIPAFLPPRAENASRTLAVMAVLMAILFLGSIGLTQYLGIVAGPEETILSALARDVLGNGPAYLLVQLATMLILTVAANTSFAGFPRIAALLAKQGFLPRQFTGLGDRLVFQNGILALGLGTAALVILFGGVTHALIPLFAVGAFLAFTLSQAGMVVHWWRERGPAWMPKMIANGVGALATGSTVLIVGAAKFLDGAWITLLLIPAMVAGFLRIRTHYQKVAASLTLNGLPPSLRPIYPSRLVIPVAGVHRGVIQAVDYARGISPNITAVHVEMEEGSGERCRQEWSTWFPDIPLVVLPSPYRSLIEPLLHFLDETDTQENDGQLATLILPEFVPAHWYQAALHNQTAWLLKAALLYHRRTLGQSRVVIDVPYRLRE